MVIDIFDGIGFLCADRVNNVVNATQLITINITCLTERENHFPDTSLKL